MKRIPVLTSLIILLFYFLRFSPANSAAPQIEVLNRAGSSVNQITDGDRIQLRLTLAEKVSTDTTVFFTLNTSPIESAACTILKGEGSCSSAPFYSLGWYWGGSSTPHPESQVQAVADDETLPASLSISIQPRPVVMVHGFISNWQAWSNYLGPTGYLASIGVPGFAVGDGQVEGVMNTGNIAQPTSPTNTIAQNAVILGEYIANVKRLTGAEMVDLIGHSMGGLTSRFYIDRVMGERDVAQLIMLGSPSAGTDCANLPAALRFYLPTVLEIKPSYMQGVFNQQITHRHGVPFSALAGTMIQDSLSSPCTEVPNDIVVSVKSVTGIELRFAEIPVLHTALNTSESVFHEFVQGKLQQDSGAFQEASDPAPLTAETPNLQFNRMYTGKVLPTSLETLTIEIEPGLKVASFALFDPSRSLQVKVQGASGNEIVLDPVKNGLIVVDDPATLVHLGYGFKDPKPGKWVVTLLATDKTPAEGADFALTAQFSGGAELQAGTDVLLPQVGDSVTIKAQLTLAGQFLDIEQAVALVRSPSGKQETITLSAKDNVVESIWTPMEPGLHAIDLQVVGKSIDGAPIERAAFLVVEAQPVEGNANRTLALAGIGLGVLCLGMLMVARLAGLLWWRKRHHKKS
jgi:hypothetical protein